jgi:uracil permease
MHNYQSTIYNLRFNDAILGAQMLFVAFGALVLVPLLTGLDPNVALFTAGLGTLIFQVITGGQVPVFLASSFAFIAPIIYGVKTWGIPGTLCGLVAAGCLYIIFSLIIQLRGIQVIQRLFPPVVTGPMIMIIGLILAPVAGNMAMGKTGDGAIQLIPFNVAMIIATISLSVTVLVSIRGKGLFRMIPILCGIFAGYAMSLCFGIIHFSKISEAQWFEIPNFVLPQWHFEAVIYILPVAIAPAIEHFGDIIAIGSITGKNYLKSPGIHRTLMGDGIATGIASMLGGPPNTTYSEVTGAVALTRIYNPAIMTWAAITAIILSFVGKVGAILQTIPVPVMGGIMLLLFGAIMVVGMKQLMQVGEELTEPRNMAIIAIMMTIGISGLRISVHDFCMEGIGLAGIMGVLLNGVLPRAKHGYPLGILVYGSMMGDPGKEIKRYVQTTIPVITPFAVEYARKSKNRINAPVLVPVKEHGAKVKAQILILKPEISEQMACDLLYRRAINFVDEPAVVYSDKDKHENNGLDIQYLENFESVEKVFYTAFAPNIVNIINPAISPDEKAKELAYLAIESLTLDTFCMHRDGIRCLIEDISSGIKTPLSEFYVREIINRASANNLNEARILIAKQKKIYPC